MPIDMERSQEKRNLATYFIMTIKENKLFQVLDPRVVREGSMDQLQAIADLTKRCLQFSGEERPTMKEVAMELEGLRKFNKHPWANQPVNEEESLGLMNETSGSADLYTVPITHYNSTGEMSEQYSLNSAVFPHRESVERESPRGSRESSCFRPPTNSSPRFRQTLPHSYPPPSPPPFNLHPPNPKPKRQPGSTNLLGYPRQTFAHPYITNPRHSVVQPYLPSSHYQHGSHISDRKYFSFRNLDVSKIFVSNFPNEWGSNDVFVWLSKWGKVIDLYIPDRRTKIGRRFAFASFLGIANVAKLVGVIDAQWIGMRKVRAKVANQKDQPKVTSTRGNSNPHKFPIKIGARTDGRSYAHAIMGCKVATKLVCGEEPVNPE
ncbi:hypothetical protein ACS0TY_023845 [Phlomoides rotata]